MRRYNKRKLTEDFDSLFELHDRIGTELKEDAHAQVSALLARCQETAILAGNRLEEDGGSHQNGFWKNTAKLCICSLWICRNIRCAPDWMRVLRR